MNPKKQTIKILFESPSIQAGEETEIKKADFEFIKKLGDGAFGQVWKVCHRTTKEIYAIKQVAKDKVVKMQAQFRREVFIMYNLDHQHIAKLYNHFEDEKYFYLIMEICEGGNLFNKLHRQKYFMEFEAGKFFLQVLQAVSYLHNHVPAIIHRDIKPENILLTKEGQVKLTDFGWSNYYSSDQQPRTTVCGTPEYLPPEMVEQKTHDTSADIWCLGVLLYEMLVGHTPFRSQVKQNMLINISKCKPKFPLSFPEPAKDLISRILVKNSTERLGVKEILEHPWVAGLQDPGFSISKQIILPQYSEGALIEFKSYKIIGEKRKIKRLDIQTMHTSSDQAALQSTSRTNQKENSSSVSNMSLSDSEMNLSDSEISKDLLEDLCQRESIKVLKEDLECKKKSIRTSRFAVSEKSGEIKTLQEKLKELQGKVTQKTSELNGCNLRVQACMDLLWKAGQELAQPSGFDTEQTLRLIQDLKQKFMSTSRASEIIKKKISTFVKKNTELDQIINSKETELENLRNELENFKTQQKKLEENNQVTLLEINKEVLQSQLSPHSVFNKENVEKFHRELSTQFNNLNCPSKENLSEKICDLIEVSKQKILKFDRKIENLRKKFLKKKNERLAKFREKKENFLENLENQKVSKIKELADLVRNEKLSIREMLQKEKMNEVKFLISSQEYEVVFEAYHVNFI